MKLFNITELVYNNTYLRGPKDLCVPENVFVVYYLIFFPSYCPAYAICAILQISTGVRGTARIIIYSPVVTVRFH